MEEAQIFSQTFIYCVVLYKPRSFARGMTFFFFLLLFLYVIMSFEIKDKNSIFQ